MNSRIKVLVLGAFLTFCFAFFSDGCKGAISDEESGKIKTAIPKKATVKPLKARCLLVFNRGKGMVHTAIPYGAEAIKLMGRVTGAFEVVESEDPNVFRPENLKKFDAVCFNNSNRMDFFKDPILANSLLDFVKNGGGIVGIHAATTNFSAQWLLDWPDGAELLGGIFNDHPWHEKVTVKIDDPEHRLNAAFGGKGFEVTDEIYQFSSPYSRDKVRVLLSLDTAKTDMNKGSRIKRDDNDFAISWIRSYGRGRVFYCSLGHDHEIFWNAAILQHLLDGIQFALGDLEADTTPSAIVAKKKAIEAGAKAAPVLRSRAEVEAVLAKAPKVSGKNVRQLKIVLLADKKDHGAGEHDYPLWQKRWKILLGGGEGEVRLHSIEAASTKRQWPGAANVEVETAWAWPSKKQFETANLIVMFCHGRGKWSEEKAADVKRFVDAGGGFVVVHSGIIATDEALATKAADAIGLAWQDGYTTYRHGPMVLNIEDLDDEICAGLGEVLFFVDEAYWPLRGDVGKLKVLATSDEKVVGGSGESKAEPMFWKLQRGRGRVFGCVLCHYNWTFDDPYFRILLLRGMAWAAGESCYRFDDLVLHGALLEGE